MFKRILLANRGEIAVRIIRACRELGVESVVTYSQADADSLPVRMADHSVCIGGPAPRDSYLNIPSIITSALLHGCDAVHPGIGFLAESQVFAETVEQTGLTWIGPSAETIELVGDKAKAREIMNQAGVPVIPGTKGVIDPRADVTKVARAFGYPLMIKAAAGGGGKGIRVVHGDDELMKSIELSRNEAQSSFGCPDVYIEKLVVEPRHIEVQVLGDLHGTVTHLWERDCSVQTTNHQKLLEEGPAPNLGDTLRRRLCETAARAARAVGYVNAGTVEFLLDRDGEFYFMEMNARLQVEHPVTELITGVDLVKQQLLVAAGERQPWRHPRTVLSGHAIELRIDARNPDRNFAPSPGLIREWIMPGGPGIRIDTHCYAGYTVPSYYDPLLAKVLVYGATREEAIRRARRAVAETFVAPTETTTDFHGRILRNAFFQRGEHTTSFVRKHMNV